MKNTSQLFCEFKYTDMIPHEQGITRRDPSPVIFAKGLYYVWYSKTNKSYDGYPADIWYATSKDGYNWQEAGPALLKGKFDEFDGYGVFTPSIIVADEALNGLDMAMRSQIINLLLELQDEMGVSFVYVSQHIGIIKHITDKIMVMHEGDVVESGSTHDVIANPSHQITQRLIESHFNKAPAH